MRIVPATATLALEARALFAREWPGGWVIVSQSRDAIVVDKALKVVRRVEIGTKPEDIALTHDGTTLLVADARTLSARDLHGSNARWNVRGNFVGCYAASDCVWAAEGRNREIEVSVRDLATGSTRRAATVADPFGGSAGMFFAHPNPKSTVIWVAGGQDGQTAYLVTDDGATLRASEIPPRDRLPVIFLPGGETYLAPGDESLEHRRWPSGECVAMLPWPTAGEEDPADPAGTYVHFLPGEFASWSSTNGRIYVVDLRSMRNVDELMIAGHPLRSIEDIYPRLRGDRTPCTDFRYSQPGHDDLVLTVHAETQLVVSRLNDWSPDPAR